MTKRKKIVGTLLLCLILSICIIVVYKHKKENEPGTKVKRHYAGKKMSEGLANSMSRVKWEFKRLRDPHTNTIPEDIRRKELQFAKGLPNDRNIGNKSIKWQNRGPYNVGGRTRAFEIDAENENRLLAAGVSGGVWCSEDAGNSWEEMTGIAHLQNVTCMVQDKRNGKTNNWYYGTGELFGNSASAAGAFFMGGGMFKSTDSGKSWQKLSSTLSVFPWYFLWNLATDNSRLDEDVVYAAGLGTIFRSADGGTSWETVLGGGNEYSYFSDIAVTSGGVAYATIGREYEGIQNSGIYRSVNGTDWVKISPDNFTRLYNRIVIGINPTNEDEVYFFGQSDSTGVLSTSYFDRTEYVLLWRYNFKSGDGSGANGEWTDLSINLPVDDDIVFNNIYTQMSYDMMIEVKPGNDDVVFIGGTNLYRSNDGFRSKDSVVQIGGYAVDTKLPDWKMYENHHPDQHGVAFMPTNSNVMYNYNDAGIFRTQDCMNNIVEWESLNRGYYTTQVYTVSIDEQGTTDEIIAGFQDNGNYFTRSTDEFAEWTLPVNGDGAYSHINKSGDIYYMSRQEGKTFKLTLDEAGNLDKFSRIDPIGGRNYLFINPFAVDPNNDNIMYMAGGRRLWRNDSLNKIQLNNTWDSISYGWTSLKDTLRFPDTSITAIAVSKNPANLVYIGTNAKKAYKITDANSVNAKRTEITGKFFPTSGGGERGYISCITTDPEDGNKVFVVFSNYNVYSLFYSKDAGASWIRVSGNLEPNLSGVGDGPSCRWASIMPFENGKRIYFLGTSTGLYATDTLLDEGEGTGTIWTQIATQEIGNVVVDMVKTRASDKLVVVGTHGQGIFSAKVDSYSDLVSVLNKAKEDFAEMSVYPNPANDFIKVKLNLLKDKEARIDIYSSAGNKISTKSHKFRKGKEELSMDLKGIKRGIYFIVVEAGDKRIFKKIVLL